VKVGTVKKSIDTGVAVEHDELVEVNHEDYR
jgi:hypothetical protein